MSSLKVESLWIYPIKSCRGISVKKIQMTKTGPAYDRQFMFVDQDNKFLTLRTEPKLSQIQPVIKDQFMILKFDGQSVEIPLAQSSEKVEAVTVWKDTFLAGVESHQINQIFSDYFGYPVKLVRYQKESFRDLQTAGTSVVKETMFSDGRPVLLTNINSLNDLNEKLSANPSNHLSEMERFRSNIIVSGLDAYHEDHLKTIQINQVTLTNAKLCGRCPIVTQDVSTGETVSKETLTTLASYRRDGNKVTFGVYFTPATLGEISVGDSVQIHA